MSIGRVERVPVPRIIDDMEVGDLFVLKDDASDSHSIHRVFMLLDKNHTPADAGHKYSCMSIRDTCHATLVTLGSKEEVIKVTRFTLLVSFG